MTAASSRAELDGAIRALVGAPPPLLVVVDFDGTLAIGSRDPAAADITPAAQRALRHLARLGAVAAPPRVVVAVLTGRIVTDVAARVRVGGIEYHGDHGLQQATLPRGGRADAIGALVTTAERFDRHRDPAEILADGVAAELGRPPWLFVERKGPSVAFHVRQADDVPTARAAVVEAIGVVERREGLHDHGLAHYRGRSVVDLRPETPVASTRRSRTCSPATDPGRWSRSATSSATSTRSRPSGRPASRIPGLVGVTVAVHAEGRPAPDELLAVADLTLDTARQVGPFLARLARAIG